VLLRPDQIRPDPAGTIHAVVTRTRFVGPGHICRLRLDSGEVIDVDLPDGPVPSTGAHIRLRLDGSPPVRVPRAATAASPRRGPEMPDIVGVSFSATMP
jgi:iron(III) transport system ATP-binding protein